MFVVLHHITLDVVFPRWEQGPLTEVDVATTKSELEELKVKGIQGVIVPGPTDTYASVNDSSDFIDFLKRAKESDVNVIVELKPGSSRKWFNNSAYQDYYIWAHSKSVDVAPNNWVNSRHFYFLTIVLKTHFSICS